VLVWEEPLVVDRDVGLDLDLGREGVDWGCTNVECLRSRTIATWILT
jgi:hypothetical protein